MEKITYYYMEGCPYCEKTNPFWDQITKKYPYKFVKIEKDQLPLGSNINGFPQFHILENGKTRIVKGSQDSLPALEKALGLKMNGGRSRSRRFRRTIRKRKRSHRNVGL